jgi:hypothetical protein
MPIDVLDEIGKTPRPDLFRGARLREVADQRLELLAVSAMLFREGSELGVLGEHGEDLGELALFVGEELRTDLRKELRAQCGIRAGFQAQEQARNLPVLPREVREHARQTEDPPLGGFDRAKYFGGDRLDSLLDSARHGLLRGCRRAKVLPRRREGASATFGRR